LTRRIDHDVPLAVNRQTLEFVSSHALNHFLKNIASQVPEDPPNVVVDHLNVAGLIGGELQQKRVAVSKFL
jgi:hypothetical protein